MGSGFDDSKWGHLFNAMDNYDIDCVPIQEVGMRHDRVPKLYSWDYRLKEHLDPSKTRSVTAFNQHDHASGPHQWGGTGIISHGDTTLHYAVRGAELSELGRWC